MGHLSANVHAYRSAVVEGAPPAAVQQLIDSTEAQRSDAAE